MIEKEKFESLWNKAEDLRKSGNFKEAVNAYKEIISQYPTTNSACARAYACLGDMYLTERKLKLSEDCLKEALNLDPLNGEYHYLLGFVNSVSGKWERAIREFEFALKQTPGKPEYMRGMGWALWNSGKKGDGLRYLQNALNISPDSTDILSDLAVISTADHDFEKSRGYTERALAVDPNNERIKELAGIVKGFEDALITEAHPKFRNRYFNYTLKVSLRNIEPLIWRRVLIPGNINLYDLHRVLQTVMGWGNYHLYEFIIGTLSFGDPDPDNQDDEMFEARRARLEMVLEGRNKFTYRYDFGDNWEHDIIVEKIEEVSISIRHAVCLEGERAGPPENSGSFIGYKNILKMCRRPALKKTEQYREVAAWLGDYDPEKFDLNRIKQRLSRMKLHLLGMPLSWKD